MCHFKLTHYPRLVRFFLCYAETMRFFDQSMGSVATLACGGYGHGGRGLFTDSEAGDHEPGLVPVDPFCLPTLPPSAIVAAFNSAAISRQLSAVSRSCLNHLSVGIWGLILSEF